MKKIILKESQLKYIIDNLVDGTINEQILNEQNYAKFGYPWPKDLAGALFRDYGGQPDAYSDESGTVYLEWEDEFHKLPNLNKLNEINFTINDDQLVAVGEHEWLNSMNKYFITNKKNVLLVPTYSVSQFEKTPSQGSLHWVDFYYTEIDKKYIKSRQKNEISKDNLPVGNLRFDNCNYQLSNELNLCTFIKLDGRLYGLFDKDKPSGDAYPISKPDEKPKKEPKYESYEFNVSKPFKFDQDVLTDIAETEFKKLIEYIKVNYQDVQGNVTVTTSASIDGKSDEKIEGKFSPCKNVGTREQYNKCLSEKRADKIIQRLKTETGNTKLTFVPNAIGETDQFDPGKKYPEVKDFKLTSENRRLIISLPKITKRVQ